MEYPLLVTVPVLWHFLVAVGADQHLKVLHLLLPAAMAVVDLQSLDGQDQQLLEHQQWKHYTLLVVAVAVAEHIIVVAAVQADLSTTQHFR
jgi:hypothetical protein